MSRLLAALLLVAGLLAGVPAQAATWAPGPERYGIAVTKDVPITLSDGTVLRADIHAPAEADGTPAAGPFPVVLGLTPYGKGEGVGEPGFGGLNPYLVKRGYIGVVADVPGTGGSRGRSQLFGPDEAAASVQVIDWAARLPNAYGTVGMIGHSYLAIVQFFAAAAVGPDSPLKAIFPMSWSTDPYRDLFVTGGLINFESSLGLLGAYAGTRTLTPLAERWSDPVDAAMLAAEHGTQALSFEATTFTDVLTDGPRRFDGPYWQERAPQRVLQRIVDNGVAVYQVGGLYDVFQRGVPLNYSGLQNAFAGRPVHAPMAVDQPVSGKYQLLFGPWTHDDIGAGVGLNELQLRWFDQWLKGIDTGIAAAATPLHVVEPGGERYDTATYPVRGGAEERLYLRAGGQLDPAAGGAGEAAASLLFSGFSQPCNRSTDQWAAGAWSGLFHDAQRPAPCADEEFVAPAPEPVSATFSTSELSEPMRLGGPIGLTLHATATTADTMFTVTVADVAPDGRTTELSSGGLLGSMRALDRDRSWPGRAGGLSLPVHRLTADAGQPVPVGESVRYDIEIRPVFATVPAGHRLRVTVGTADTPHLTPPPSTWMALAGGRYTLEQPSWIDLPVVP